ncbi:class I SAM-dependent methyltransferase [Sporosarcina thermotolerans]
MEYRGPSVYDQEDFRKKYMNHRDRQDSPNIAIEKPIIYELLGDFHGKSVLDLGCGNAAFGKELLHLGAKFYTGIEGSERMSALANQNLIEENAQIYHETMETFRYPTNEYEIITSRFAIHYVDDIQSLFQNVYQSLKEDGRFIFSIQHPLTTSS